MKASMKKAAGKASRKSSTKAGSSKKASSKPSGAGSAKIKPASEEVRPLAESLDPQLSRVKPSFESEEDLFVTPEPGKEYGRCGGRPLKSLMEKHICDRLSALGVAHSHAPRRFEVKVGGDKVAAYSPCIVLRGRGREGKTMVIEVLATANELQVKKIEAFRALYQSEFYVILLAPATVLENLSFSVFDEPVLPSEIEGLVGRLAE